VQGFVHGTAVSVVIMPARRRPRGHIRELPSGSFQAIVYAGVDPLTGKERYLRETSRTYDQAEVSLTRLQAQVDEDRHPKSGITIGQAVTQWLDVVDLEDTTRERYQDLIRIYIAPTFGDLAAAKLDAELLGRSTRASSDVERSAMAKRVRATSVGRSAAAQSGRSTSSSAARWSAPCGGGISE
jgi:hypothetical protein